MIEVNFAVTQRRPSSPDDGEFLFLWQMVNCDLFEQHFPRCSTTAVTAGTAALHLSVLVLLLQRPSRSKHAHLQVSKEKYSYTREVNKNVQFTGWSNEFCSDKR